MLFSRRFASGGGLIAKIARRVNMQFLPNLIGAQGLFDVNAAKQNCLPYVGAVGLSNLGDEVVLEVARRSFPTRRLVPAKGSPWLQRFVLNRCIKLRLGLLVGGGTLILSDGLLSTLEQGARHGIPFVTFGSGVHDPAFCGRLDAGKVKRWRAAFKTCAALGVRGPLSRAILDDLGIANAQIVGDPAALYTRCQFHSPRTEKVLGVNIGTAWSRVYGNDEGRPVAELAAAVARLKAAGWSFRFFCVWPYDLPVVRKVMIQAGLDGAEADIVEEYYCAERFIEEVSACRVFLGMKLHAVILSVCAGVPTLGLEYRPKVKDYMASVGAESEVLRLDQYNGEMLADAVEALSEQADTVAFRQWNGSRKLAETFSAYVGLLNAGIGDWPRLASEGCGQLICAGSWRQEQ